MRTVNSRTAATICNGFHFTVTTITIICDRLPSNSSVPARDDGFLQHESTLAKRSRDYYKTLNITAFFTV